jgi:hypothetical protein
MAVVVTQDQWDSIDWSKLNNYQIAAKLKIPVSRVWYERRMQGRPASPHKRRPKWWPAAFKLADREWNSQRIADKLGKTRQAVDHALAKRERLAKAADVEKPKRKALKCSSN